MLTETDLLQQIEAFCQRNAMTDTAFGKAVLGDFNFVEDLRTGGRSPKLKTVKKVIEFMEDHIGEVR